MKKSRKTREDKIKSSERTKKAPQKKALETKKNITSSAKDYKREDIKRSLMASAVIFGINILLFILLSTNTVSLGFLGY